MLEPPICLICLLVSPVLYQFLAFTFAVLIFVFITLWGPMGLMAPLLTPSFAFPRGAAKLVSLLPPLNGLPNALPKTELPKTLVLFDADVSKGDFSVVPKPADKLFTNVPNPPLIAALGSWAPFLSASAFPRFKTPAAAKGLPVTAVDEPPNVPKGDVEEPASAAKPEEAKASAEV